MTADASVDEAEGVDRCEVENEPDEALFTRRQGRTGHRGVARTRPVHGPGVGQVRRLVRLGYHPSATMGRDAAS